MSVELQYKYVLSLASAVALYWVFPSPPAIVSQTTRMEELLHWAKAVMAEREQGAGLGDWMFGG